MADRTWTYEFPVPTASYQGDPALIPYGTCVDLVGVDGRHRGSLRRFPGMRKLTTIPDFVSTAVVGGFDSGFDAGFWKGAGAADLLKYAELPKGTTGTVLRGFVWRSGYTVKFWYYDPDTGDWASQTLLTDADGPLSVTYGGRYLWLSSSHSSGASVHYDLDGGFHVLPFGHRGAAPFIRNLQLSVVDGAIDKDVVEADLFYTLGYQLYDARRGVSGPLRWLEYQGALAGADFCFTGEILLDDRDVAAYTTIRLYRTKNYGTTFYKEREIDITAVLSNERADLASFSGDGSPATPLGTAGGTIALIWGALPSKTITATYYVRGVDTDLTLVYRDSWDEANADFGQAPNFGKVYYSDGVMVGTNDETQEGRAYNMIRFSQILGLQCAEVFPSSQVYDLPRVSDQVLKFVRAGDFVYAVCDGRIFRLSIVGSQITGERILHGWGCAGENGCCEVGPDVAILGRAALTLLNGSTGSVQTVGSVERVLSSDREWAGTLSDVTVEYDSYGNCLFLLNHELEEALCLWGTTSSVTRLKDMSFDYLTRGPHCEDGGMDVAYFVDATGQVFYVDWDRDEIVPNMRGLQHRLNGTATSPMVGTALTDSAGDWETDELAGVYLYALTGDSAGERRLVEGNSGTEIRVYAPGLTMAAGDRYSLAPVPMEVVGWPIPLLSDPNTPTETVTRRNVQAMGVRVGTMSDGASSGYEVFFYRLYEDPLGDPLASTSGFATTEQDDCWGAVAGGRPVLFPAIGCYTAGLDLTLQSMVVDGTLEATMES